MSLNSYPSAAQHTIAIAQVEQILQGVRNRQMDWQGVLRRAGIAPALLDSPLSRVTQTQFARLIFELRRVTRDELWGLCEHRLSVGSFALGCELLVHCKTLGEAMQTGLRYYHQQLQDFVPRLQVCEGVATYRQSTRGPADAGLIYAQRVFMFFSFGLACWLVARRIPLREVIYTHPESGLRSDASRLFQAPVRFQPDWMGYRFDARWLGLPVVQNTESLRDFLQQAPTSLLVRYRDQTSLTERIRRLLRRYLAEAMPSLDEVSQSLAMTPQTLRRHLQREGQGYQAIKDSLRRDVAVEYLSQPDLTLLDIANRLGFSEASTFHRAFKGWTGLAPGVYRQRRLQGQVPSHEAHDEDR
jgi:AraC-like DNA-binding protein